MKHIKKKAMLEGPILIISICIIAVLIIVFVVKYSTSKQKVMELNENFAYISDKSLLINYLNTPYKDGTIADYIETDEASSLGNALDQIIANVGKYSTWRLTIKTAGETKKAEKPGFKEKKNQPMQKIMLPSSNPGNGLIEVWIELT